MRKKKIALMVSAFAMIVAIALSGCSGINDSVKIDAKKSQLGNKMEQWGQKYPNQYNSIYADVGTTMDEHSHGGRLKWICEIPTPRTGAGTMIRDENGRIAVDNVYLNYETGEWVVEMPEKGDYSEFGLSVSCYKCKTQIYNDYVDKYGAENISGVPITDDTIAYVDDQYFNCATCHEGDPGEGNPSPQIYGFMDENGKYGALMEGVDAKITVCAQCHNSSSGTGIDAETVFEGRSVTTDPNGLEIKKVFHPDAEMVLSSNHYSLGLTCVDCHMTQETAEDGSTYTSHTASQPVLENEAALELCLTCHNSQGIKTTGEMREMVKSLQADCAERTVAIYDRQVALGKAIAEAKANGTLSETDLKTVLENYKWIYYYRSWLWDDNNNPLDPGTKIPMNAADTRDVIDRVEAMLEDTEALLR